MNVHATHSTDTLYGTDDVSHLDSMRMVGPKYPPHDSSAPIFGKEDVPGLIVTFIMALGPLTAYALGFGL